MKLLLPAALAAFACAGAASAENVTNYADLPDSLKECASSTTTEQYFPERLEGFADLFGVIDENCAYQSSTVWQIVHCETTQAVSFVVKRGSPTSHSNLETFDHVSAVGELREELVEAAEEGGSGSIPLDEVKARATALGIELNGEGIVRGNFCERVASSSGWD